jgi:hypothetical protein
MRSREIVSFCSNNSGAIRYCESVDASGSVSDSKKFGGYLIWEVPPADSKRLNYCRVTEAISNKIMTLPNTIFEIVYRE